jgi:hypothetical protein
MAANKIMLIRHAEKPEGTVKGVTKDGTEDEEELIVRGWQRSGALARFFAPRNGAFTSPHLAQPKTIFASAVIKEGSSRRPRHTVLELSKLLDLSVNADFAKGDEAHLAKAAVAAVGPVLIAWQHEAIPDIVNTITGNDGTCPQKWDGARFDLVWVLDRAAAGGGWSFSQVPQMLLSGDSTDPIA